MKTLDIFNKQEKNEYISFDEFMDYDGNWSISVYECDIIQCKKLNYQTKKYDYFIRQTETGEHYLYRNKK